jgi:O-antigen/teichoic acid export membrane protein
MPVNGWPNSPIERLSEQDFTPTHRRPGPEGTTPRMSTSSTTRATMKHAAVYSAAAMAGRLVGFFMLPFYAHILRGHGYAVIGMLDVGLGFLLALLVYGLQGSIIRLYHDEKDPARKPVVVSTGIILIGTTTALLTIPLILFARPISAFLIDDANLSRLMIMALLSFNLDMMGQAASSWLLVRSRSAQMAGLSLLRLFIGLSLNIYLILIKGMGLDGYFISSLVTNAFSCLVFVGIAFRECGREFDPKIARTIRGFLLPLIPGSIASWVGRQVERILVKTMISLESVGIMEMGYKFPVLIAVLATRPFMRSWETRRFEIADEPDAPQTIARMFTYFIFILSWLGLIMAVVVKPVLEILTPPEFHLSYRIARVEIVTVIMQGAGYHLLFGLAYAKDTAMLSAGDHLKELSDPIESLLRNVQTGKFGILKRHYHPARDRQVTWRLTLLVSPPSILVLALYYVINGTVSGPKYILILSESISLTKRKGPHSMVIKIAFTPNTAEHLLLIDKPLQSFRQSRMILPWPVVPVTPAEEGKHGQRCY